MENKGHIWRMEYNSDELAVGKHDFTQLRLVVEAITAHKMEMDWTKTV